MKKFEFFISTTYCKKCGALFAIPRKKAYKRKEGHIKHLYCVHCGKRTPHIERI